MLVTHGKIITWEEPNQILENHAILIEGNLIKEIGPEKELIDRYPGEQRLDANNQYIMPGNICAHTHFYGAYSRGMAIPGSPAKDFPEILSKLWWALDKALDSKAVRLSAQVCLIDAIRHGTTTLLDHHASPNAIEGSLNIIAEEVLRSGLRASLCYEVTDRDGQERRDAGISENCQFIDWVQREHSGHQLAAHFGLHASLTLSQETLEKCASLAPADVGFHIHVAEHPVDEYDSLNKAHMRVIDRLDAFGILRNRTIAVHCVHIDAREMELLARSGSWVTHQPRSNMNNAVGLPDVQAMIRMGIPVCLGNDGFSNAMWEEWKTAYLAHKLLRMDPRWMNGSLLAQIASYNNSALATQVFDQPVGMIRPGAAADLILVDYHPFTDLTPGNLPWHIIFGFHESMISDVIASGKLIMRDRKVLVLDEQSVAAEAREHSHIVWENYSRQFTG